MKTVKQTRQSNVPSDRPFEWVEQPRDKPREKTVEAVFTKDPSMPRQSAELLQERHRQIAELAYYKAQQRGFEPGHELEDWLAAEAEVDKASRPLESY